MKARNVPEWAIVRIDDGRVGVLSKQNSNTRYMVMLTDGTGVEIRPNASVEVMLYPAVGMMQLLKNFR